MPLDLPTGALGAFSVEDGRYTLPRLRGEGERMLQYERGDVSRIEGIAIHHTATGPDTPPEVLARYHVDVHGWPAIGYHVLVYESGRVIWCLDLEEWGAHVKGRNDHLWGVALVGNYQERPPARWHLQHAYRVVAELQTIRGEFLPVDGHNGWALPGNGTACPGTTSPDWLDVLQRRGVDQDAFWQFHTE